jgi:radical SAM protein with 4Fe4S-binding SPASM domain
MENATVPKNNNDNVAKLYKIVDKLADAGIFELRFFGGEFTVFKEWKKLMTYVVRKGIFVSFVSNGYLLQKNEVDFITSCRVRECTISIHGTEELHDKISKKKGSYARAIKSIKLLKSNGIRVSVVFTPIRENIDSLYTFVKELYVKHEIQHFGVNRLFPSLNHNRLQLSDYKKILNVIHRLHVELGVEIRLTDSLPRCLVPLNRWEYLSYCSQGTGFAQVDYNGNIKHCSAITAPIGNIFEENIVKVWTNSLNSFRELEHLPNSCKICPIFCGGGCTASRGIENQFASDVFIPTPGNESRIQSIAKYFFNRIRKSYFDFVYRPIWIKEKSGTNSIEIHDDLVIPALSQRYKQRKETNKYFLVMFEKSGVFSLTEIGINLLKHIDGKLNVGELLTQCQDNGLTFNKEDVYDFFNLYLTKIECCL